MKNKLMLGGTLLVAAFFAIGSVNARGVRSASSSASVTSPLTQTLPKPEQLAPVYLTNEQMAEKQKQIAAKQQGQAVSTEGIEKPDEGKILLEKLLGYSVPWGQEAQNMYDQNKNKLSEDQGNRLFNEYQRKLLLNEANQEAGKLKGMLQSKQQESASTQQVAGPSLPSFESVSSGAYDRAKAFLSMGGQKLQNTWEGLKGMGSRAWESTLGDYGSSMGGYKYLLPGALILSAPGALVGGAGLAATALWSLGGSAAILGVSNVLDRLNYVYETGGYASTTAHVNDVKNAIAAQLNDQAAYPYYASKIEALNSENELYAVSKDKFGVAKKAHDILLNEAQKAQSAKEDNKETIFIDAIAQVRSGYGYNSLDTAAYISGLEKDDALIKAQALVSEYSRAKNRKKIEEETKKQAAAELAKKAAEAKEKAAQESAAQMRADQLATDTP